MDLGMAEGDAIHRTARALQEALGAKRILDIAVPNPRSPLRRQGDRVERLRGATLTEAEARGEHLLLSLEGDLVLHSHLGMRGSWRVVSTRQRRPRDRRAWVVLTADDVEALELDGSRLDLRTEREVRSDPRLRALGPDVLAPQFDG